MQYAAMRWAVSGRAESQRSRNGPASLRVRDKLHRTAAGQEEGRSESHGGKELGRPAAKLEMSGLIHGLMPGVVVVWGCQGRRVAQDSKC